MKQAHELGEPSLALVGFRLWVHGRRFPDAELDFDFNWLQATAHCEASGASVWVRGGILMTVDIAQFKEQCEALLRLGVGSATLDPLEPELKVVLTGGDPHGHVGARVEITPDHLAQFHRMDFEIDQSYLPGLIGQCTDILREYPVRGDAGRKRRSR